jgi:GNAT superfamily N-acetyltransferase
MPKAADRISVREATANDIPQLCGLLAILFAQEADFKPSARKQARGLRLLLKQPDVGRIYCATEGKAVIGMVSILFTVSTAEGGRVAWLEDMVIHPTRRGRQIGRRLLRVAIRGARAAGCRRVTLLTDATNKPAMHFYKRAGFARSRMVPFRLGL